MSSSRLLVVDLDPESINALSRNFWNSAILRAGIKLDIFSLLEPEGLTYNETAQFLGAAPRFVHAFLNACVALGLLELNGNEYRNSPSASNFLIKGKQHYVGDLVLHITNHWESWGRLDQLVKEGKTLLPFETGYVDAPTYWTDYMMGQHNRAAAGQAYHLVQNVDLSGKHKLLDLGGGAASYSIALCGVNPQLNAVVVDQKEPLAIARGLVEEHGLQSRITLLEGNFNTIELGKGYDVVLISGVVLIKSEEECRCLFKLAYDVMEPGGLVIIQDFMRVDHSPERSFMDTLMDIYVLIAFDPCAGDRFGDELAAWLEDAGFRKPKMIPLPTHLALILAEKPLSYNSPEEPRTTRPPQFLPTEP
jgi:cyclopropane fatty-acyl-phospholipid synthase-like methyltransferase